MKKDLVNRLKQNLEKLHAQQLEPLVQDNENISTPQVEDPVITTPPDNQIKISTTPRPERPPVVVELPPCHDPCHPETWRRNCQIDNTPEPPDDYESQNCPFPNDVRRAQIVRLCETCPESPCLVAPDGRKIYDCDTGQFDEALICELARDNYCQTGQLTVAGCPCLNPGNPMGFPNNPTGQSIDCWNCVQYLKPGGNFSYPPQTQNPCSLFDIATTLDECTAKFLSEQSMDGRCGWSYCNITQCNNRVGSLCAVLNSLAIEDGNDRLCAQIQQYEELCRGKPVLNDQECSLCFRLSSYLSLIKKHFDEGTLEILCECCRDRYGSRPFECPTKIPDCIKNATDFPPPQKGYKGNVCPDGLFNSNDCCCGYQDFAPRCRKKVCVERGEEGRALLKLIKDKIKAKIPSCTKVYTTPNGITYPCGYGECHDYCFDNPDNVINFIITLLNRLSSGSSFGAFPTQIAGRCYFLPEGYDSLEQYIDAILACDCQIELRLRDPDQPILNRPGWRHNEVCIINFDCDLWSEFTFGRSDCSGSESRPCYTFTPAPLPLLPQIPPPNGPVPPPPEPPPIEPRRYR